MAENNDASIQQHSLELSSRAASTPLYYTVGAAILCGLLGYAGDAILRQSGVASSYVLLFVGLVAGGIGGYRIGTDKAVSLRLQAEIALCQMKVRDNLEDQS